MSAGVFGVAFIFFNLRQTLVLKRFFATPIKRSYIVLGEGLSRVIFQLITAVVILLAGHYFFNFTLIHGFVTFIELLVLSFVGLLVFMGFGFVVSGVAKNESVIPPLANLFTLPQFLLAGTFFSIDNFPSWLQPICRVLPLTHMNDAMRNIAFGKGAWHRSLMVGTRYGLQPGRKLSMEKGARREPSEIGGRQPECTFVTAMPLTTKPNPADGPTRQPACMRVSKVWPANRIARWKIARVPPIITAFNHYERLRVENEFTHQCPAV